MRSFKTPFLITLILLAFYSCNAQTSDPKKSENPTSQEVHVYYFHYTKRCVTCNAVENETKMVLETFYSDKIKEGKIDFSSLNLEKEEGSTLAESLRVSGQTLLIVKGSTRVNLTNEGFMNARTQPDRFHEILKDNIDKLL